MSKTPTEQYAEARMSGAHKPPAPKYTLPAFVNFKNIALTVALVLVLAYTYKIATSSAPRSTVTTDAGAVLNGISGINDSITDLSGNIKDLITEIREDRVIGNPDRPIDVDPDIEPRVIVKWRTKIVEKPVYRTRERIVYRDNPGLEREIARLRDCYNYQREMLKVFMDRPKISSHKYRIVLANNCGGTVDNALGSTTLNNEYIR